jgi:hypothetical protein
LENFEKFPKWAEKVDSRKKKVCCDYTCDHCDGNGVDDCTKCGEHSNRELVDDEFCKCKKGFSNLKD